MSFRSQTHLAVAVASQLRNEADVILADLDHLFADVVLGAAGYRCASPPAAVGGGVGEGGGCKCIVSTAGRTGRLPRSTRFHFKQRMTVATVSQESRKKRFPSPGFVLLKMSAGLDVAGQLDLHVTKQRDHLELL